MKWIILFFSIIVGISTSDIINLDPSMWEYWINVFTISLMGSLAAFLGGLDD